MPKSDYITGVTSALLYFKLNGKSDADHFGYFGPFLWNTWVFSTKCSALQKEPALVYATHKVLAIFFRIVSIQVRRYTFFKNSKFEITIIITITFT